MNEIIINLLNEFVKRTAEHFNLDFDEALEAVCHSKLANDIAANGNTNNYSIEDLCFHLFEDISKGS